MDREASCLDHQLGRRRLLAAAVALLSLRAGGSGADAKDETKTPASTSTPVPSAAGTAEITPVGSPLASPVASGPNFEAGMQGLKFWPPKIEIEVGTTVVWTNQDVVVHTATQRAAPADQLFGSPFLSPGESYSFTFDEPGTYAVICKPHLFMSQTVVVTEKE